MTIFAALALAVSMTACGNTDSVQTTDKETQTVHESDVTEQEMEKQSPGQDVNVAGTDRNIGSCLLQCNKKEEYEKQI